MSLVAFDKVAKVFPDEATGMAGGFTAPLDLTVGHAERPHLYDSLWGYIAKFSQAAGFQYDQSNTYATSATFTITGAFTRNAEAGGDGSTFTDTQAFNSLFQRYQFLEAVFDGAADAIAPADYAQWGTAADPRVLPLPAPLVDKNGDPVYVLPISLTVEPGQWANKIGYRAVLREAKFAKRKVMVNSTLLDNAQININLPSPLLFRKRLVGCAGEAIQFQNYTVMEIEVSGHVPRKRTSTEPVSQYSVELAESMWLESVDVFVVDPAAAGGKVILFGNMDPDGGSGIDATGVAYEDVVTVRMKARS